MNTFKRASKNIFFKATSEILSRLIYLVFFIYMARKLGASDFGLFSFAFSFAGIFVILIDPGLNILLTRDISRDKSLTGKYINNVFAIKLFLTVFTFLLLWASISSIGYDNYTVRVVLIMGILLILNCFLDLFVAISNAYEKMELDAVMKTTNKLFISMFGIGALLLENRLADLISWLVAGSLIAIIFSYHLIKKTITKIKMEFEWEYSKKLLKNAFPMALTMIFSAIYFKIDVVMLSLFNISNSDIGLYSAAIRLIEALNVLPAIIVGGLFPVMAILYNSSRPEFEATCRNSYKFLLILVIPIVVITTFLSNEIIMTLYGHEYTGSASALKILIWTSLFIFPNFLLLYLIVIFNRQKLTALFTFISLCLNIILNIFLIPHYGFIGAGIATVATDMAFFTASAVFTASQLRSTGFLKNSIRPAVCGILLAVILYSFKNLNIALVLPLAVISYSGLIFLTKTLTFEEVNQLRGLIVKAKT